MPFSRIKIASFRNLEDAEVGTDAKRVFLVGDNGQGKTNFLEALYYLSYGTSFRGAVDAEAARRGRHNSLSRVIQSRVIARMVFLITSELAGETRSRISRATIRPYSIARN